MRTNPLGWLAAVASIFSTSTSMGLELMRPLLDATVPPGGTVQFQPGYRSDLPVSFIWRSEGRVLRGQTNSTLVISNAEPKDVGSYSVILTAGGTQLISSATLDLDVPYPAAAFGAAFPTRFPTQSYALGGSFPDGTLCGVGNYGGYRLGWYGSVVGIDSITGSNKWTILNEYQIVGATTYRACVTADGKCIVGRPWLQLSGYGGGPNGVFATVTPAGETGTRFGFGNLVTSFLLDSQQNVHFISQSVSNTLAAYNGGQVVYTETRTGVAIACIADRNGRLVLSRTLPYGYSTVGRLFYARRAEAAPLSGVPSGNPTNWVFGALTSAGDVRWVAEAPVLPFTSPIPDGTDASSGFTALATDGLERIASTGEVLWKLPISFRPLPEDVHINSLGHSQIFSMFRDAAKVGNIALPANADAPLIFIDIDRAGVVRTAARLNCSGVDENELSGVIHAREFAWVSAGHYHTTMMMKTNATINGVSFSSTSNRVFIAQMSVPEPDVSLSPLPESTMIVTNAGSITLKASPDVPGAVMYQWFRDSQPLVNGSAHDLTITNFNFAQAGRYSVRLRNAYGTASNAIATVNYSGPVALGVDLIAEDGSVLVRWPTNSVTLRLEVTSDLLQPFVAASGVVATNAGLARCEMRFNPGATHTFYRLAAK